MPYFRSLVNIGSLLSTMIAIQIVELSEGNHPFKVEIDASQIPGLTPEILGMISTEGVLRKFGNRYILDAEACGIARLVCDRSLEEFDEPLKAALHIEFKIDHSLAAKQHGREGEFDDEEVRGIYEVDKVIDITEDVRQVLTVAIPFRRVAPAYRDNKLNEIHTSVTVRDSNDLDLPVEVDDRWSALTKLKRS